MSELRFEDFWDDMNLSPPPCFLSRNQILYVNSSGAFCSCLSEKYNWKDT